MTINQTISSLPKEILVKEDEKNGKISFGLNHSSFFSDQRLKRKKKKIIQSIIHKFKMNYGYEFDQVVFRGRGLKVVLLTPGLYWKNRNEINYHYFILSNDYFNKQGIWSINKILDVFGTNLYLRLGYEEWKQLKYLTGDYFPYKFSDKFAGQYFPDWAYNVRVPFGDIVSISFLDPF